jgi:hypothetical protein
MLLLARAHHCRQRHKPQPYRSHGPEPVDPRHGLLPGWVADLLRATFPTYNHTDR